MAQAMVTNFDNITNYLLNRPISVVYSDCVEKQSPTALRFMCVLDYYMEDCDLYTRISRCSQPKLLTQLLQFRQFEKFLYYDYQRNASNRQIGTSLLQCYCCELVGPFSCILTHMAISHNVHIGIKMCLYCKSVDLKSHFLDNSFEECYNKYKQKRAIEMDYEVYGIVIDFYNMLRKLSKALNILRIRSPKFIGHSSPYSEKLRKNYGSDLSNRCIVYSQQIRKGNKSLESALLDEEFERVMSKMYGDVTRLLTVTTTPAIEDSKSIIIDTDDEEFDGKEQKSNIVGNSAQSAGHCSGQMESTPNLRQSEDFIDPPIMNGATANVADSMMPGHYFILDQRFQNQSSPIVSTSSIVSTSMDAPRNFESCSMPEYPANAFSSAESAASSSTTGTDLFCSLIAQKVAQKLARIQDRNKREETEIAILEAVVNAGREEPQ